MPEQKIEFESNGLKTSGVLLMPPKPSETVVVLCHGYSTHKNNSTQMVLASLLQKAGIASFRFDFFGHGESEGKFGELSVQKGVQNVLDAVKTMQQKGFSEIGLVGSSFGGLCVTLAAPQTKRLMALGLKAPLLDIRENEKRSFFDGFKPWDGYRALQKIRCPILIVHGDADTIVPIEQSKKATEVNPLCQLVALHGADHSFSRPQDRSQLIESMAAFLEEKTLQSSEK